ncbi:hypothetical protein WJX72_007459 [[Myrmecia] bisecta]|uniref:Uncharacterized protein n=1 Tax=[Myrmecia] bisecta TaxID=41462 RepID=A0AAW1PK68_9CHLO
MAHYIGDFKKQVVEGEPATEAWAAEYHQRVGRFLPLLPPGWDVREVRAPHRKPCSGCGQCKFYAGDYYFFSSSWWEAQ